MSVNLDHIIAVRNTKTVFRDGDRCIKVFIDGRRRADILMEALNLVRAEEAGVPVPRFQEVTTVDGKWALICQYIPGKTLAQMLEECPERQSALLERFVDIHRSVHARSCPALPRLKDEYRRGIADAPLEEATRANLLARLKDMPDGECVCHGGFDLTNVIITDDDAPFIVDWLRASRGDACADAARTTLLFWLNGDVDGADRYLSLFCRGSDAERGRVFAWFPFTAAAMSVRNAEKRHRLLRTWVGI